MIIEIVPLKGEQRFSVWFIDGSLETVKRIRILSVSSLLGRGHKIKATGIEKEGETFFFNVSAEGKNFATKLFSSLNEAIKEIERESLYR